MNCSITNEQREKNGARCRGFGCQPCRDFYKPAGKEPSQNHIRWELLKKILQVFTNLMV